MKWGFRWNERKSEEIDNNEVMRRRYTWGLDKIVVEQWVKEKEKGSSKSIWRLKKGKRDKLKYVRTRREYRELFKGKKEMKQKEIEKGVNSLKMKGQK